MSIPTRGESYARLMEHLRLAQEEAAMLAHLHNAEQNDKDKLIARAWLHVSELFKGVQHKVTELAMGRLN